MIKPVSQLGEYSVVSKQISASDLNTLIAIAKSMGNLSVQPPLGLANVGGQLVIYMKETPVEVFLGKIVATGPAAAADYTDDRYWFKNVYCDNSSGADTTKLTFSAYADTHDDYIHATATNLAENDFVASHTIAVDTVVCMFALFDDQSPPIKRYYFWQSGAGTCASPKTLYTTYEGSETAQTDTWDVTDQGVNDGMKVYLTTRIVYNDSGDETLYGFYREFKYDSTGRLINISAETRYTIDAADDC